MSVQQLSNLKLNLTKELVQLKYFPLISEREKEETAGTGMSRHSDPNMEGRSQISAWS